MLFGLVALAPALVFSSHTRYEGRWLLAGLAVVHSFGENLSAGIEYTSDARLENFNGFIE